MPTIHTVVLPDGQALPDQPNEIARLPERDIDITRANREEMLRKIRNGIAIIKQHHTDVVATLDTWSGLNATQAMAVLGSEIIPALRDALKGVDWLAQLEVDDVQDSGL